MSIEAFDIAIGLHGALTRYLEALDSRLPQFPGEFHDLCDALAEETGRILESGGPPEEPLASIRMLGMLGQRLEQDQPTRWSSGSAQRCENVRFFLQYLGISRGVLRARQHSQDETTGSEALLAFYHSVYEFASNMVGSNPQPFDARHELARLEQFMIAPPRGRSTARRDSPGESPAGDHVYRHETKPRENAESSRPPAHSPEGIARTPRKPSPKPAAETPRPRQASGGYDRQDEGETTPRPGAPPRPSGAPAGKPQTGAGELLWQSEDLRGWENSFRQATERIREDREHGRFRGRDRSRDAPLQRRPDWLVQADERLNVLWKDTDKEAERPSAGRPSAPPDSVRRPDKKRTSQDRQAVPDETEPEFTHEIRQRDLSGSRIGDYLLENLIVTGNVSRIYRSKHPRWRDEILVEVFADDPFAEHTIYPTFWGELERAATVSHKNLISIIEVGVKDSHRFVVFELFRGTSVGQLISKHKLFEESKALKITLHVLDALRAARRLGLVHRHVTPDNIIVNSAGHVKLAGLGMGKLRYAGGIDSDPRAATYVAPELLAEGSYIDFRTDIYGLGATLYHMVTGTPPYYAGSAAEMFQAHQHKPLDDPRKRTDTLGSGTAGVILHMMEKRPSQRHESLEELGLEIESLLDKSPRSGNSTSQIGARLFSNFRRGGG